MSSCVSTDSESVEHVQSPATKQGDAEGQPGNRDTPGDLYGVERPAETGHHAGQRADGGADPTPGPDHASSGASGVAGGAESGRSAAMVRKAPMSELERTIRSADAVVREYETRRERRDKASAPARDPITEDERRAVADVINALGDE